MQVVMQKTHNQGLVVLDKDAYDKLDKNFVAEVSEPKMTEKQRGSLHLWCESVAKFLNSVGLPCVQKSMFGGQDIELDWNMHMIKELQYKRVLHALTGKSSTEQQSTVEPSKVAETIIRHYSANGVVLPPWPSLGGK